MCIYLRIPCIKHCIKHFFELLNELKQFCTLINQLYLFCSKNAYVAHHLSLSTAHFFMFIECVYVGLKAETPDRFMHAKNESCIVILKHNIHKYQLQIFITVFFFFSNTDVGTVEFKKD